jgi:hypothetical protein
LFFNNYAKHFKAFYSSVFWAAHQTTFYRKLFFFVV